MTGRTSGVAPRRAALKLLAAAVALAAVAPACASRGGGLPRRAFRIGGRRVTLEIAATERERERGMMFRESVGEDEGMLFVFADEIPRSFWMKNCKVDLSIAYLDSAGRIVSILEMKKEPPGSFDFPGYPSGIPAQFAIEMRAGWFRDHGVAPGSTVEIPDDVRRLAE